MRVLAEPIGRNTAAAMTLATIAIERPDDEVMLVLPADHRIADETLLPGRPRAAADRPRPRAPSTSRTRWSRSASRSTPGDRVRLLDPGLARGAEVGGLDAYPLVRFEEKPNQARAAELAQQAGVAWNAGIFLWRRRAIRDALERHTALFTLIGSVAHSEMALAAAYEQLRPVSIDYAVMEGAAQAGRVVMGAMDVGWNDLGGWTRVARCARRGLERAGRVPRRDGRPRPR